MGVFGEVRTGQGERFDWAPLGRDAHFVDGGLQVPGGDAAVAQRLGDAEACLAAAPPRESRRGNNFRKGINSPAKGVAISPA
jgi:hypothetical protein